MAKNNHIDNEIQSKLDKIFFDQDFSVEETDGGKFEKHLNAAALYATVENGIAVLSDFKTRFSYIFYGFLGEKLGIATRGSTEVLNSIWEDVILSRIPDEHLQRKQADEMIFFSYVRRHGSLESHYLSNWMEMNDSYGKLHCIKHRIFYFNEGKSIRYALCLYNSAADIHPSVIIDTKTGEEILLSQLADGDKKVISPREIEVLSLISKGYSSKEIAIVLGISIHTVSRHRQNLIESMNVRNCTEACKMASLLGII